MAKKDTRFEVVQTEGNGLSGPLCQVLLDKVTGVQYLFTVSGYAGGLTPLLDADGKPMTWHV